ncbi:hypothetical protein BKA67DRAFT_120069 [Truncatella angustata]|uniref:Uncharacterized protein n=1 Tax=Truncatella angustata TaxID=152316 RepID=A0A9P8U8W1_9PEZI|nr:uncharacterized protein BKA67DRAFT_120069 [Truncatella angustata]KAH6645619.1 hypothetical protein BKA67DRAFT_120069 [Truncatella angustata]
MLPAVITMDHYEAERGQFLVYTVKSRALLAHVETLDQHETDRVGKSLPFIIIVINGLDSTEDDCIDEEDVKSLARRIKVSRAGATGARPFKESKIRRVRSLI